MTPQELEQIERTFDKARSTSPQALADWAEGNGRLLFATVREALRQPIASDDPRRNAPAFDIVDEVALDLLNALRPFAALGAPVCLTALGEYRILNDVPEDLAVFAVPNMDGEGALAFVTAEQLRAAHDLINEIDGGGGA